MPPITKIWLFTLKPDESVSSAKFQFTFSDVLDLTSSYTNPDSDPTTPPMHVLYQDIDRPSQLVMITGYPSQELNTECDKVYAATLMPRMFEMVEHVWLRQLDVDVREMPLTSERVVLTCGDAEVTATKGGSGVGGWDVWQATQQAQTDRDGAQGTRKGESAEEKVWVQIMAGEKGEGAGGSDPTVRETFYLKRVLGR